MALGSEIGKLSLRVVPDAAGFNADLRRQIQSSKDDDIEVKVSPDATGFTEKVKAAVARAQAGQRGIDIPLTVDQRGVKRAIADVQKSLKNVEIDPNLKAGSSAKITDALTRALARNRGEVEVQTKFVIPTVDLQEELKRMAARIKANAPVVEVQPRVSSDAWDNLFADLGDEGGGRGASVQLGLDFEPGDLAKMESTIKRLADTKIDIDLREDLAAAERQIKLFEEERHVINFQVDIDKFNADLFQAQSGASFGVPDDFDVSLRELDQAFDTHAVAHERWVDRISRSNDRAKLSFASLGRVLGTVLKVGSIATPVLALTSYLGAAVIQATALVGELAQIGGLLAVAPAGLIGIAAIIGTLVLGFQGIGDALKGGDTPEAIEKQAAAMASLTPAAQGFVKAIQGLKPAFRDLREAVQEKLFSGMEAPMRNLATNFIPALKVGLGDVAAGLANVGKSMLKSLGGEQVSGLFQGLFSSTGRGLSEISKGMDPLIRGIARIGEAGARFFPRFGRAAAEAFGTFDKWVGKITSDGTFDRWVNSATGNLKDLYHITGNVGSVLASVFRAGPQDMLTGIREVTQNLREWAKSAQGQFTLGQMFAGARAILQSMNPVLTNIGQTLVTLSPFLVQMSQILGPALANTFSALQPAFASLGEFIVRFSSSFSRLLADIGPAFGNMIQKIGPPLSALVDTIGRIAGPALAGAFAGIGTVVSVAASALNGLLAILRPLGPVITIVAQAAVLLFAAFKAAAGIRIAAAALATFGTSMAAANAAGMAASGMANRFTTGVGKVAGVATTAGSAISKMGVALPIVGAGFLALGAIQQYYAEQTRKNIATVLEQNKAIALGGQAGANAAAGLAKYQEVGEKLSKGGGAQASLGKGILDNIKAGTQAYKDYYNALSPVQQLQEKAAAAEANYAKARADFGANSAQAVAALAALNGATSALASAQNDLANATKLAGDKMKEQMATAIAASDASVGYQQSVINTKNAQAELNTLLKEQPGNLQAIAQAQLNVVTTSKAQAQAASDKAVAEAEAAGVTDSAAAGTRAYYLEMGKLVKAAGKNAPAALKSLYASLGDSIAQAQVASGAMSVLKGKVLDVPDKRTIHVNALTQPEIEKLKTLGYTIRQLPDGSFEVTANTGAALSAANAAYASIDGRVATIYVQTLTTGRSVKAGYGLRYGGWVQGPGTSTSDSIRLNENTNVSRREFVTNASQAAQHGDMLEAINSGVGIAQAAAKYVGDNQISQGSGIERTNHFHLPSGTDAHALSREIDRLDGMSYI